MIQSLWRSYSTRQSYYEYLRITHEAKSKKIRKPQGSGQKRPNSRQTRNLKQAQKYIQSNL